MSGFIAILNLAGAPVDGQWLQEATQWLAFRGPDAQKSWHEGSIGLGHALLRTTFEDSYDQQPATLDSHVWLVADARLDDRTRLLDELRARGRNIAPETSDSLFILHAYHLWGEACLDHLAGDFAFVLWDGRSRHLFCARDQMGVVPLFYAQVYAQAGQTLIVSNTQRLLLQFPGVTTRINEDALVDFVLFQSNLETDSTIYAQVRRLPPAHKLCATVDGCEGGEIEGDKRGHAIATHGIEIRRYWQLPEDVEILRPRHPQEVVEHFRSLLEQAVADRLRTSRATSALSGGLDSTSVAALAQRLLQAQTQPGELRAATTVYRELIQEQEGLFAQQVADHCGFTTQQYIAEEYLLRSPNLDPLFPDVEPWTVRDLWSDTAIRTDMADFSRIYLAGFGGDPLFHFAQLPWATALRLGQWRIIARDLRSMGRNRRNRQLLEKLEAYQRQLIGPDLAARVNIAERQARFRQLLQRHDQRRGMTFAPLWETIFRVSDPGFTCDPIKYRFPFFDLRLVEFMLTLPPDPWCRKKYLLREAMRGLLPESVRQRPKTILGDFPHFKMVQKHGVPTWMHELIAQPGLGSYVNLAQVQDQLATPEKLDSTTFSALFSTLGLANWLRGVDRLPTR